MRSNSSLRMEKKDVMCFVRISIAGSWATLICWNHLILISFVRWFQILAITRTNVAALQTMITRPTIKTKYRSISQTKSQINTCSPFQEISPTSYIQIFTRNQSFKFWMIIIWSSGRYESRRARSLVVSPRTWKMGSSWLQVRSTIIILNCDIRIEHQPKSSSSEESKLIVKGSLIWK